MATEMQDLNDLYYFARVVEHGGFAPAARALDMHKSKLSRRIALLEDSLGVRLIQRSTRRFAVTEIGQAYYGHCVAMLVEAEAAQEAVERTRAEPQGIVRQGSADSQSRFAFAVSTLRARRATQERLAVSSRSGNAVRNVLTANPEGASPVAPSSALYLLA